MEPEVAMYRTLLDPVVGDRGEQPFSGPGDETRRANLSATLAMLHLAGQQSRTDIVNTLGLSRSTVSSLVGELIAAGLAEEAGVDRQPSPGRPSQVVRLTSTTIALAIEVAPAYIAVATVELGGRVRFITRRELPVPVPLTDLTTDIRRMAEEQLSALDDDASLVGIGVAIHGLVSADGVLQHAPNLGWSRTDVRGIITEQLPGRTVVVGNEATLAAIGEHLRGALQGVRDGIIVVGDIGVGGGAIIDGRLLRGTDAFGAEVGHMGVEMDGRDCRCGATGCWETRVGLEAIMRHCGVTSREAGTDVIGLLRHRADEGDADVIAGLERTGRWLGFGLGTLINLLNPSRIIVGGRLGQLMPLMSSGVHAGLERRALRASLEHCELVPPALGRDAALIGAAEHVFWNAITTLDLLDPPITASASHL